MKGICFMSIDWIARRGSIPALIICVFLLVTAAAAQTVTPQRSTTGPKPPPWVGPKDAYPWPRPAAPTVTSNTIEGTPGYLWRHGCGPTAVGMVCGYYATHGFADLFDDDASTQSEAVNQGIASQGSGVRGSGLQVHYENYSLPNDDATTDVIPDSSETYPAGCHTNNSVADFMHTSWSREDSHYGSSWSSSIDPGFTSYTLFRNTNYAAEVTQHYFWDTLTFTLLMSEINSNRPMVFLVDTGGTGKTDHFVTIVAYEDGIPPKYGCLDTWPPASAIRWCEFRGLTQGNPWGIWGGWSFRISKTTAVTEWSLYE